MRILILVLLLVHTGLMAQQAEPLLFKERIHDFGDITEDGGNAETEFGFINNSGRAMKIILVQPSCGCTTSGWSKDVIAPGGTGFIKATFDPKHRPGYFNKSLTVTTDLDGTPMVLQIKGLVMSTAQVIASVDFPVEKGNLRLRFSTFNLDKVFVNLPPAPKEFAVYNAGTKTIKLVGIVNGPAYIKAEMPKELAPNTKGVIKITYDGKMKGQYGFMSDNIEIGTDDDLQPTKSFSVYATLEEFFPLVSREEAAKSPVLRVEASTIDLGKLQEGTTIDREVAIRNMGKKELIIRSIQENCTCLTASVDPLKLKPGALTKVKISFNTTGRNGTQQKAITFYTNDPKNPVQRITLTAYIN